MALDLSSLNTSQHQAVTAPAGPTLIIAGPGTGKTHTLAYRIAFLLEQSPSSHASLLAITFTRKAASEMSERASMLLSNPAAGPPFWIGTFHQLGLNILRREAQRLSRYQDFHVLTEPERIFLIKELLAEMLPQESQNSASQWARRISEIKNQVQSRNQLDSLSEDTAALLIRYEDRLASLNLFDCDDLVSKALFLLQKHSSIRNRLRAEIGPVLVDEYQDINSSQYCLLKELCGEKHDLWAIGDADQAIYAFRGAEAEYFLRFAEDFPQTVTISLKENYRSSPIILSSAQALISHNTHRFSVELIATRKEDLPCTLHEAAHEQTEAQFVSREIEKLVGGMRMEYSSIVDHGYSFADIAVLYRLHHLAHPIVKALKQAGIPFQLVGASPEKTVSLFDTAILFLQAVAHPHNDRTLSTVLLSSAGKLDFPVVCRLRAAAREAESSLCDYLENDHASGLLSEPQSDSASSLLGQIKRCQTQATEETLPHILNEIVTVLCHAASGTGDDVDSIHRQLLLLAEPFAHGPAERQLIPFLESLALWKEGETYNPKAETVTLMTVHAAKGLEFPVVFIVGLEAGFFPCTEFKNRPVDIEEERRLLYVGMTRAKIRLYLSSCRSRYWFGERLDRSPSPFLNEIPKGGLHIDRSQKEPKSGKKGGSKQRSLF